MSEEYVSVGDERIRLASRRYREPDPKVTAELLAILSEGPRVWNRWRDRNPNVYVDFRNCRPLPGVLLDGINLSGAMLHGVGCGRTSFRGADLSSAYLYGAVLQFAKLEGANLSGAYLGEADLIGATLTGADLRGASFNRANMMLCLADNADFRKADLELSYMVGGSFVGANFAEATLTNAMLRESTFIGADFSRASLEGATLVDADFTSAKLDGSRVFGASVWRLQTEGMEQRNLVITGPGEPEITVDNLKVAQFIYLILHNEEIRHVIDTITSKLVLVLGRFTPERKRLLDGVRAALRTQGLLPVVFDFQVPDHRGIQETVSTLAHLARFIVADISDPQSIPQELAVIVPTLPSVPVKPLILRGQQPWGMFESISRYPWVLDLFEYEDFDDVEKAVVSEIIAPAERYLAGARSR